MELRKGHHVVHTFQRDEHGVGTIVSVRGEGEEREYEVAWPMPGSGPLVWWEPAAAVRLAPPE